MTLNDHNTSYNKLVSIGFFGIPNSGKSSLINMLSKKNICIISDKPQTTQEITDSVFVHRSIHISLIDTPGINYKPLGMRGVINKIALSALHKVMYRFFIIAADKPVLPEISGFDFTGSYFILTKIDKVSTNELILISHTLQEKYKPAEIFFTSLKNDEKTEVLMDFIEELSKDKTEEDAENKEIPNSGTNVPLESIYILKTREQIFNLFTKEIPYNIIVKNTNIEDKLNLLHIEQSILVPREAYRKIILGNLNIKIIREKSEWNIRKIVQKKVILSLKVVISKNIDIFKDIGSRKVGAEDWL